MKMNSKTYTANTKLEKYESVATLYNSIYDYLYGELKKDAEAFFAFYDQYPLFHLIFN